MYVFNFHSGAGAVSAAPAPVNPDTVPLQPAEREVEYVYEDDPRAESNLIDKLDYRIQCLESERSFWRRMTYRVTGEVHPESVKWYQAEIFKCCGLARCDMVGCLHGTACGIYGNCRVVIEMCG